MSRDSRGRTMFSLVSEHSLQRLPKWLGGHRYDRWDWETRDRFGHRLITLFNGYRKVATICVVNTNLFGSAERMVEDCA